MAWRRRRQAWRRRFDFDDNPALRQVDSLSSEKYYARGSHLGDECLHEAIALASRPPSLSAEQDFNRRFGLHLECQCPGSEPLLDEQQAAGDFRLVDPSVSDLPPEIDFECLPRWMCAELEQGPPEDLEFEDRELEVEGSGG
jgi:hypothetical protein